MSSWIPPEMRWLYRQVRPFLYWHIASFLCMSVGSFLALLSPLVLKWMIDVVLPGRRVGFLVGSVVLIFLCHQGRAVLTTVGGYLTMLAAQRLALALRLQLLRHLDTLSADYHEGTPVGASMYPLKEPIDEISYLGSDLVPSILRTILATVLTLGTMLILNPRMTLAILPLIPVFVLTRKHFRNRLERDANAVQHNQVAWSSFLQEHLSVYRCDTTPAPRSAAGAHGVSLVGCRCSVVCQALPNRGFVHLLHQPDHRVGHVGRHWIRRLECSRRYAHG